MQSKTSNLTRLLCANVILKGGPFREQVLNLLKDRFRAAAPEIGIDLGLVAQVSKYMERRDTTYYIILSAILIVGICCPLSFLPLVGSYGFILILFLYIPITAIISFIKSYDERFRIGSNFTTDKFDPEYVKEHLAIPLRENERKALPQADQNLIVYRDFFPFVGAGIDLGGWSFAINTTRPTEEAQTVKNFGINELYSTLEQTTQGLQFDTQVRDMLFVHGTDIRKDNDILPGPYSRPLQTLPQNLMEQYKQSSDMRVRHYMWVKVEDWNSELVLSLFLRCSMRGQNLFVEVNRFLLTPLQSQISQIDALPLKNWRSIVNMGLRSLVIGPFSPFGYIGILFKRMSNFVDQLLGQESREKREVENNLLYNYGASKSLREITSSPIFNRYFQKLDNQMYIKIFDKEVLEAIVTFLDEHDVDTSELKERKTTILNNGIIVQGGNIQAESVAAGSGSQAIVNRVTKMLGGNKEKE